MGLDAGSAHPVDDLGVGLRDARRAVETDPQRGPPRVHQHLGQGQRPGIWHPAGGRGPALAASPPRAAVVERPECAVLRVRHRGVRCRLRRSGQAGELGHAAGTCRSRADVHEGPCASDEGLRGVAAAVGALVPPYVDRQPDRLRAAQRVESLGDHVWPLPRGRPDLRATVRGPRRESWPVVPAPDAGVSRRDRPAAAACLGRQPQPSDRAPSLPGPAEQPVRRDGAPGTFAPRAPRSALPRRVVAAASRLGLAQGAPPLVSRAARTR